MSFAAVEEEPRIAAWNRRMDWPLTALAVVFLVAYAWQVLDTSLGPAARERLDVALTVIWVLFGADYAIRLVLARRKWRFVGTHLLDLAVLLLPMLRQLRALRVILVISVMHRQLRDDFRGRVGVYVVGTVGLIAFVASLAVLDAERNAPDASITTFGDAIWWTLTTISTVGYGDRYPVTLEGRVVAASLMVAGIALLGVVTASIASWFVENLRQAGERVADEVEEIEESGERTAVHAGRRAGGAARDQRPAGRAGARPAPLLTGRVAGPACLVASTGPIRSSAAVMSVPVRSAWVISRTWPDIALARTPDVGEARDRAVEVGHGDEDDVGLRGLHLPAPVLQARGQRRGAGVVLGEPVDAVQRHEARRGQHPALPHPAAEHLAQPPCLLDELGRARHQRADRRAEALAQADLHGVGADRQRAWRHPERDGGVPQPGAVEVHPQVRRPCRRSERGVLLGPGHGAARRVVRVLQAQERGAQRVVGAGRSGGAADRVRARPCRGPRRAASAGACRPRATPRCPARRRARARLPWRGRRRRGRGGPSAR